MRRSDVIQAVVGAAVGTMSLSPVTASDDLQLQAEAAPAMTASANAGHAEIIRPRRNAPYIRISGETITINVACDADVERVILQSDTGVVVLEVRDMVRETVVYDAATGATYDTTVMATIPDKTPPALYDLLLKTLAGWTIQRKAVKVLSGYKRDFTFVHLSDTHIGVQDYQKWNPYLNNVITEIKKISPEFLVITGDCIHNACDRGKQGPAEYLWRDFWSYFDQLDIPVFVCPGNHDYRDKTNALAEYNRLMGLRYFSFDYGSSHFVMLDNALDCWKNDGEDDNWIPPGYEEQVRWADADLAQHKDSDLRVVLQHIFYKDGVPTDREKLLAQLEMPAYFKAMCDRRCVDVLLDAHTHCNVEGAFGQTPTQRFSIASASSNYDPARFGVGWFRVLRVNDAQLVSYQSVQAQ